MILVSDGDYRNYKIRCAPSTRIVTYSPWTLSLHTSQACNMSQQKKLDPRTSFGSKLRQLRTDLGLSQEALADKASLDRTYISGCERGQRNVSLVNIYKISEALGVDAAELLQPAENEQRRRNKIMSSR
jgi:ribosome-binding protein aMBF1 (putative translation factor)